MSNTRLRIARAPTIASASPIPIPAATSRSPWATTIVRTDRASAPSATRIPTSRVRRSTVYAITPYSPAAAITSAIVANTSSRVVVKRAVASESDSDDSSVVTSRDRLIAIHRQDGGSNRRHECERIADGRAHDETHRRPRPLRVRRVGLRLRRLRQPGVLHVADDADDFGESRKASDQDALADRAIPWATPAAPGLR